jgi:sigma-B regulation protein RsbU (phosphoserine phosphatase)
MAGRDYIDLFENAPCGYLVLDPVGRITMSNRIVSEWLGYSAEELKGKRLLELLSVAGRIFFETHFAPLLRMQGYFNEVALDLVAKHGVRTAVLANATMLRDGDGEFSETRLTFFQATERRKYERQLVDTRDISESKRRELSEANADLLAVAKLRDEFIAVVGHDLRNPLASIRGGLRMLEREALSNRGAEIIALMGRSVDRMNGLIDNVLDLTRGRLGGGLRIVREPAVQLEPVIRQVVAELVSAMPERKIVITINIDAPVSADLGRVGQLASNLLGNALTHGASDTEVEISASTVDDDFVLSVANVGETIDPETAARLFEPFFRGGDRQPTEGLGLGLHISSEIAKAHGGTLTVSSEDGRTEFTLRIPREG